MGNHWLNVADQPTIRLNESFFTEGKMVPSMPTKEPMSMRKHHPYGPRKKLRADPTPAIEVSKAVASRTPSSSRTDKA